MSVRILKCVGATAILLAGIEGTNATATGLVFQAAGGQGPEAARGIAQTKPLTQEKQAFTEQSVPGAALTVRLEQALRRALDAIEKVKDKNEYVRALVALARIQIKAGNPKTAAERCNRPSSLPKP
jgi:hypothetical protein